MIKTFIACLFALIVFHTFAPKAETITTGNLLPNSGDGVDWGSSSTDQINPANSSGYVSNGSTINGFDITCSASQYNCGYRYSVGGDFEVTGTATVSVDDIALTNNSINQSMLDNGITLNSYIDVANCESTEGNCESKGGNNDSHTTTVKLKNSSGTVLSTTTQTRTDVSGFQGNCNGYPTTTTTGITANCGQYNDRIIYLGLGANKVDWSWSGTDSNYTNQSRQGPNLLGASLNMTYNNTEFNPIDDDTQEVIEDIDEDIIDIIDDIPEDFDLSAFIDEFIKGSKDIGVHDKKDIIAGDGKQVKITKEDIAEGLEIFLEEQEDILDEKRKRSKKRTKKKRSAKKKKKGKKDACYYKVKSRYSVWPSAYASGALVKCRRVGAKNWCTGGKKKE